MTDEEIKARVETTINALDTAFGGRSQWCFHTGCRALYGVCNNATGNRAKYSDFIKMVKMLIGIFADDGDAYGYVVNLVTDKELLCEAKEVLR